MNLNSQDNSEFKTIHGYNIEEVKTAFLSAFLNKDEENALFWGYEIYYSDLKFEIFYLLNEMYNLFYVEKHAYYFNGYLQTLAKKWEESKRKNHTILGSIIKNLVRMDISITDMIRNKTPNANIVSIIKHDNSLSNIEDFISISEDQRDSVFKLMTLDELCKLKQKLKKAKKQIPAKILVPTYVCELFEIQIDNNKLTEYIAFVAWCNIHENNSIKQTVLLRCRRRRICNNR